MENHSGIYFLARNPSNSAELLPIPFSIRSDGALKEINPPTSTMALNWVSISEIAESRNYLRVTKR